MKVIEIVRNTNSKLFHLHIKQQMVRALCQQMVFGEVQTVRLLGVDIALTQPAFFSDFWKQNKHKNIWKISIFNHTPAKSTTTLSQDKRTNSNNASHTTHGMPKQHLKMLSRQSNTQSHNQSVSFLTESSYYYKQFLQRHKNMETYLTR